MWRLSSRPSTLCHVYNHDQYFCFISCFKSPPLYRGKFPWVLPQKGEKICLGPICTFMQNFRVIGSTIASVTGQRKKQQQDFLFFHPSNFHSNITHLQNALQQISSWMTANLLTLNFSKTEFLFIGLKQQLSKIHDCSFSTTHSTNTLPSRTKSLHFLNLATITFVNFAVSAHISTSKQPAPLPPPLLILNLITVTLSITTFQTINLTGSNRSRTLLHVLLLRLLNPHISLLFSDLSTGLRSTYALNINFFLLPTKFLQPST